MIKLIHITPRFLPAIGGCEYYVYNMSKHLLSRGYNIGVVTSKSLDFNHPIRIDFKPPFIARSRKPLPPDQEIIDGIKVYRLDTYLTMPGIIVVSGLKDLLNRLDADIYNLHEYLSNIVVSSQKILLGKGKPIVLTVHDITYASSISPIYRMLWRMYNRLFSKTLCSADKIIVQNLNDKKLIDGICGFNDGRAIVVYNGVDTDFFDPEKVYEDIITGFKRMYNLERYDKILLFVGRIEERKRIDLLMLVMHILVNIKGYKRLGLLIVGPDYGAKGRLAYMINKLGLEDNIVFTGPLTLDQLRTAYMVSDIFITLSEQEAFGLTAVEAMSMGKPVITHRWRGLDEVVKHGVNGLKAKPFDYYGAAKLVEKLLEDEGLYRRLGMNAYRIAREKYSVRRMVNRIDAIYRELL